MARLAIAVKVLLVVCLAAGAGWGVTSGFQMFPQYIDDVKVGETVEVSLIGYGLPAITGATVNLSATGAVFVASNNGGAFLAHPLTYEDLASLITVSPKTTGASVSGDAVLATVTLKKITDTKEAIVQATSISLTITGGTTINYDDDTTDDDNDLILRSVINPSIQLGKRGRAVLPNEPMAFEVLVDPSKYSSSIGGQTLKANIRPQGSLTATTSLDLLTLPTGGDPQVIKMSWTPPASQALGNYYMDLVVNGELNAVPQSISAAGGFALNSTLFSIPPAMLVAPGATSAQVPINVQGAFTSAQVTVRVVEKGIEAGSVGLGTATAPSDKARGWKEVTATLGTGTAIPPYVTLENLTVGNDGLLALEIAKVDVNGDGYADEVAAPGRSSLERGYGDVDGNGIISSVDGSLVLMHTVGKVQLNATTAQTDADLLTLMDQTSGWTPPANAVAEADVSGLGGVSPLDASLILRKRVRLLEGDAFPIEKDYYLLWQMMPGAHAKLVADGQDAVDRTVSLGMVEERNGALAVPVLIDEMEGVLAGSFTLEFDPQRVQPVLVASGELTKDYLFADKVDDNTLRVSFAGIDWKSGQGTLAEVQLQPLVDGGASLAADVRLSEVVLNEGVTRTRIDRASPLPRTLALYPNFPNPFNPSTTLRFDLPQDGQVELQIYNVVGQQVRTLVRGAQEAGHYKLEWDGTDDAGRQVASGTYMARLETQAGVLVQKMLMIK